MKLIVAVTGASGATLSKKFIDNLPKDIDLYLVLSKHAKTVIKKESGLNIFKNSDISAPISSGSFKCDAMIVLPCSMNTLAKIAYGISDNLITRAASVMIKEHKKLILAPRELPFSSIALENMVKLSKLQVTIAPPVIGYYSEPKELEEMENFLIGKWFDLLGIEHNLFKRWSGDKK